MNNRHMNGGVHMNGSSVHSSRSVTPEPVADLPVHAPQEYVQNDDRPPTPFPAVNIDAQPMDQVLADIIQLPIFNRTPSPPPIPLVVPVLPRREQQLENPQSSFVRPASPPPIPLVVPVSPRREQQLENPQSSFVRPPSPPPIPLCLPSIPRRRQPLVIPQVIISDSSLDQQLNTLTPIVNIHHPFHGSETSNGADSFKGTEHLSRSIQDDRQRNEDSRFRSIASGLYEFANVMMPGLPAYEPIVFPDDDDEAETNNRSNGTFTRRLGIVVAVIGAILLGKHFGHFLFNLKNR